MNAAENFTIRLATSRDLPAVLETWLENLHISFDPSLVPPNREEAAQYWKQKLEGQNQIYPIWVAEDEGQILGFLALSPLYSGHPVLNAVFGEASVYIGKAHQGRGIGVQLLKKAVAHCNSSPLKFILATTTAENASSQKVLHRMGWQKMGTIPATAKAPQLPALLYFVYMAQNQDAPVNIMDQPVLLAV